MIASDKREMKGRHKSAVQLAPGWPLTSASRRGADYIGF